MCWRLVAAVYHSTLPGWLKPYAAACASFAAEDGTRVYPSIARLAKTVGHSARATQTALHELHRRGVLEVQAAARQHQATHYRFNAAALPQLGDGTQLMLFRPRPQRFQQGKTGKG